MPILTEKHARMRPCRADGLRILVTRYWPYGLRRGACDLWLPALGPSKGLLTWLWGPPEGRSGVNPGSTPSHAVFRQRYLRELEAQRALIADLRRRHRSGETITLLCACHDPAQCHRTILAGVILSGLPRRGAK